MDVRSMQFVRELRPRVRSGEITCSVRIWKQPRVKVGGFYPLSPGEIEVVSIRVMNLDEITPSLARRSGFAGVQELMKIAQHGTGENVFLVEFVYHD
jgi:hypothetical protein